MTTNRVRAGVPSGGQFSPIVRAEGLVALEAHGAEMRRPAAAAEATPPPVAATAPRRSHLRWSDLEDGSEWMDEPLVDEFAGDPVVHGPAVSPVPEWAAADGQVYCDFCGQPVIGNWNSICHRCNEADHSGIAL